MDRGRRGQQLGAAVSRLVALPEELGADGSAGVKDHEAGVWDAARAWARFLVEEPVGADHLTIWIGEQREADAALLREAFEYRARVVADGDQLDTGTLDRLEVLLQLDQLPLAVGSPVGRAVEEDRELFLPLRELSLREKRTEASRRAGLVDEAKIWRLGTNRKAKVSVRLGGAGGEHASHHDTDDCRRTRHRAQVTRHRAQV